MGCYISRHHEQVIARFEEDELHTVLTGAWIPANALFSECGELGGVFSIEGACVGEGPPEFYAFEAEEPCSAEDIYVGA